MIYKAKKYLINKLQNYNNTYGCMRDIISYKYLSGSGIELGALHNPLIYNHNNVKVRYVDRMSKEDLKLHYPELDKYNLVDIDIIDDGEKLEKIENYSQDFIIANHMLEHCINPIKTIENFLSKCKVGGLLFITIPEKNYTFDSKRDLTSFEHIKNDYFNSHNESQIHHFIEWVNFSEDNSLLDSTSKELRVIELHNKGYSIHYHVWDIITYLDFLNKANEFLNKKYEIILYLLNNDEIISLLRKIKN